MSPNPPATPASGGSQLGVGPAVNPRRRATWSPLVWATLALAGATLLQVDRSPPWLLIVSFGLIGWRLAASVRAVPLPGRIVRGLIAIGSVGLVALHFRTLNGLNAGTSLLALMSAIKLLETQNRRDQFIVVGGSLFLLLAACLAEQSLLRTPLYLLETWVSCAAFAVIAYSPPTAPRTPAKRRRKRPTTTVLAGVGLDNRAAMGLAGRALLYSLPLAVVLFLLFPRLPGAFWSLPRSADAETGLSDTMSPGSISQLTSSYDTAFRVRFDGAPPPPRERYWRGPVLHDFDGYTWSRKPDSAYGAEPLEPVGPAYRYHVSLEPSQQKWWFSLDTVDRTPDSKVALSFDYELIARDPVTSPTSYTAVSHTQTRPTQPLSKLARQVETNMPAGRNPRSLKLARELRARAGSDGRYIASVLQYLRTGGFVYSLTPPLLSYDSVDDFIFSTRSGFCGHYASAFVTLMRDAGVPARVVTGYLGGEWNPIGGYFIVRQSDAHSWAEVWLDDSGWTRIDPTAVVEPERLTRGMLDLLPAAGSAPTRLVRSSAALTRLMQRWDALNTWWNDNVLKYNYRAQLNLLSRLGVPSPDAGTLAWWFATAVFIWLGWIAVRFGRALPKQPPDRLARAYAKLCRKLERAGLARAGHQGPLDYADAVSAQRPDLAHSVRSLLTSYAELRYGAPPTRADAVAGFERAVARLDLKRPARAFPGT